MDANPHPTHPPRLIECFANARPDDATVTAIITGIAEHLLPLHRWGMSHGNLHPGSLRWSLAEGVMLPPTRATRSAGSDGSLHLHVQPGYSAPEAYLGGEASAPWSDIYALGAVAYWLITGNHVDDAPHRLLNHTVELGLGAQALPGSGRLRTLIDAMLDLHPGKRPHNAEAILMSLKAVTHPAPAIETPPQPAAFVPDAGRIAQTKQALGEHLLPSVVTALINQAARDARDEHSFVAGLGQHLDNPQLRQLVGSIFQRSDAPTSDASKGPATNGDASLGVQVGDPDGLALAALEAELKNILGAVAPIVVRRAARRSRSLAAVVDHVTADIDDAERARQFREWAEHHVIRNA